MVTISEMATIKSGVYAFYTHAFQTEKMGFTNKPI